MPTFQIQFRRDVTANWESCNPVLLDGEMGLEVKEDGTRLFKLGDGVTAWLDLPYSSGPKGEDFKYEDFTPEQLELLRGPKGDAFKYEDFTPAQLATLKGETGETGATGDTGPMPAHRWSGTELQFQDASGAWGQSVDLKGAKGDVADGVEIELRLTEKLNTELEQAKDELKEIVPTPSDDLPLAPGEASVGTSDKFARADHVHPLQASISGNAATATKLQTARTINGVAFDGSEDIEIPTGSDGTVSLKGTRGSTSGDSWSITGLTIGKPLYIIAITTSSATSAVSSTIKLVSGTNDKFYNSEITLGTGSSNKDIVCIPTSTTVVISIHSTSSYVSFRAYQ